jgi:hypothetical protein
VQHAKIGPDKDIPHITPPIIVKYITNQASKESAIGDRNQASHTQSPPRRAWLQTALS